LTQAARSTFSFPHFAGLLKGDKLMGKDKPKRGPYADNRVNPHEPNEIKYWSQKFNCTEMELKHAVRAVGTSSEAVMKFLKTRAGNQSHLA
jgi:hypothetical protein